ncbi:MAG: hypothetical protein ACTSRS_22395 [Candidatus Helarchaeota archaeon]
MTTNLDRFKDDIDKLIMKGEKLEIAIQMSCEPENKNRLREQLGENANQFIASIPSFRKEYQAWYSEAQILIKKLLPDRLLDFIRYYQKPKGRKEISYENYRIEDFLQGLTLTRGYEKIKVVGPDAAIPLFQQQLAILKSVKARFESSLFDIRQLVQADLFDSEIEAAKELNKHKFARAAGALAGVVLERHLSQVCKDHNIKITRKKPGIAFLNDTLKESKVVDIPQWRFVQHLGDIRNLCDHDKKVEPTPEQVDDLISGTMKITKTVI